MEVTRYLILAFLPFMDVSLDLLVDAGCITQQVKAVFSLDATNNINQEQRQYMFKFVGEVSQTFPDGSEGSCAYINNENVELLEFFSPIKNTNLSSLLETTYKEKIKLGRKISTSALENETSKRFSVSDFKSKAEVFYLIVSDKTDFEDFPAILLKKKVFVIVLGSTIPIALKNLATSNEHAYLIRSLDDVSRVSDNIAKQTCIDSHYKCDVDQYMKKRSIKCKSCMSVCSVVTTTRSNTCTLLCPYFRRPPKEDAVKRERVTDKKHDNKGTAIIVTVYVMFALCIVTVNVVTFRVCRRKKLACFATEHLQDDLHTDHPIHESDAVPETEDPNNTVLDRENGSAIPLLDGVVTANSSLPASTSCSQGFNINFRNNTELDMNGHVFAGSTFQPVH
ncbi:uncharacterized protein LOC123550167 isoform X2 [Mercenaria mercenaria]|uniref:uncharacterized protein LOC123550167 isoform X2 n=1 Tax=Mercenaria mercenaria TaxID=6596 RepID=UPI00234F44A1|nr:uncharacterized protein LOC123550167 isoform X2 [Mercenaria mercenaria]